MCDGKVCIMCGECKPLREYRPRTYFYTPVSGATRTYEYFSRTCIPCLRIKFPDLRPRKTSRRWIKNR